jgi:hypothetical protein
MTEKRIVKTTTPFTTVLPNGVAYVATIATYSDGSTAIIPFEG